MGNQCRQFAKWHDSLGPQVSFLFLFWTTKTFSQYLFLSPYSSPRRHSFHFELRFKNCECQKGSEWPCVAVVQFSLHWLWRVACWVIEHHNRVFRLDRWHLIYFVIEVSWSKGSHKWILRLPSVYSMRIPWESGIHHTGECEFKKPSSKRVRSSSK